MIIPPHLVAAAVKGGLWGLGIGAGLSLLTEEPKPRRVFFSFHYERDIWRVNQVRNHWVVKTEREDRQAAGYFDGSLWEEAQTKGEARVKRLIDDGLNGSSVTCVLVGAETYSRHWVDYEIFRSVELGKGVFGVRVHNLKDQNGTVDVRGNNPFRFLGFVPDGQKLKPMAKYKSGWKTFTKVPSISPSAAPYLTAGSKPTLSSLFPVYDWVGDDGYHNFSAWVSAAAKKAGR